MAINPLSSPITREYKPLGLEAFAVPLSQLQKKFDLTEQQLSDTDYSVKHLSADDLRSKELMGNLNQNTSDLSEALVRTGNFREVGNKLKQLNKYYNKNPEIAAIKSNHTAYKTSWAEMDKLRQDEKITAQQMKDWETWAKGNFKGTNYDKETGAYNTGNFRTTGADVRQEMMTEARAMAKMTSETQDAAITRMVNLGVSGEEAQRLAKISIDTKDKEVVASEIAAVLSKIPKYSDYLEFDSEIQFYNKNETTKQNALYNNSDPLTFSKEVLEASLPSLQARRNILTSIRDNENISEDQRNLAEQELINLDESIQDVELGISGSDPDLTENLAEAYYKANSLGYINDLASSTADLVDFVHRDISGFGGNGGVSSKAKEKIDEVGDVMISIGEVNSNKAPKVSGLSTTYTQEANADAGTSNLNELFKENELVKANSLASETITRVMNKWTKRQWDRKDPDSYKYKNEKGEYVLPDIYKNGADVAALDQFNQKYDDRLEELDGELVELNTKLADLSPSSAEYRQVSSEIVGLYTDREQNILSKTKQLKDLDYNINELFLSLENAGIGTKDFSFDKLQSSLDKMSSMNGYNQFSGFVEELKSRYEGKSERGKQKFMKELSEVSKLWSGNTKSSTEFMSNLQDLSEDNINISIDLSNTGTEGELAVKFTNEMYNSTDPSSLILRNIFDQFKLSKSLGSEGYIQIPKVNYTEGLNSYTDGKMDELKKAVENNPNDFRRVEFDPTTRTSTTAYRKGNFESYDLEVYTENPTIVGRDSKDNLILKYEKKPKYRTANTGTSKYFTDVKNGVRSSSKNNEVSEKNAEEQKDYSFTFTKEDITDFERNNPNELYITSNQTNLDPILAAENNYVDLVVAGLNTGDNPEGIEIIEQQRNNYAPLHLINSNDRAMRYSRMAKTLVEKAKKGIKGEEFQGPATTKDNGDGSFTSYGIVYKTTTDNKIIAQVTRTTKIPSNKSGVPDEILESVELPSTNITLGRNLPLALLKMDMTFGTGDEQDLITTRKSGYDVPFIIAFEKGFIFEDSNNLNIMDNISN